MSGNIKPVPPCTGLITRFVQQNVLLLRTTAIHGGYVGNNPVNFIDPWGLSASDGRGNNGNANLLLSGLTKTLSGSVKTVTGLAGAAAGMLASAVLVADNGTVVLTVDDAALLVTVPFTAASGKYALNGAKEAVDGLTDLTAGVVGTTKTLGTWIGGKAKSALDNIWGSNKEKTEREKSPKNLPPGTRELDRVKLPKGVDHRKIKQGLGLGAADWTGITPDGDIIVNDGEGNAEVAGNLEDFQ